MKVLRMSEERTKMNWPLDYEVGSEKCPIAILIVGRGQVKIPKEDFAIKGVLKTENVGLEKVVANIISNPNIRFLIACGKEEFGHFPGHALIGLWKNGVDEHKRIRCEKSAIPYLCNLDREAVERFRSQVTLIDHIYPKNADEIVAYDPIYNFDEARTDGLLEAIKACKANSPGPYPSAPLVILNQGLVQEGGKVGAQLNRLADTFVSSMLQMPSERLSTNASLAVLSNEFGVVYDPVDGSVSTAPSAEFAGRLKSYLRGGE
jgi:tetrahydromethanopterin S-methyltransferase subunit A